MEEPRILGTTVHDFLSLLGGERFQIEVKHNPKRWLDRIPVLISSNEPLTIRLNGPHVDAITTRVIQFTFSQQISSLTYHGPIPPAPFQLCTCHLRELFYLYNFLPRPPQLPPSPLSQQQPPSPWQQPPSPNDIPIDTFILSNRHPLPTTV